MFSILDWLNTFIPTRVKSLQTIMLPMAKNHMPFGLDTSAYILASTGSAEIERFFAGQNSLAAWAARPQDSDT